MRVSLVIGLIVVAVGVAVVLVFSRGSESRLSGSQTSAPTESSSQPARPSLPAAPPVSTAPRPHPEALREAIKPAAEPSPERTLVEAAEAACMTKDEAAAQKYYEQVSEKARARVSIACQAAGITLKAPPKGKAPVPAP